MVTGAAGSGKTTTLGALINEINQTQNIRVNTLEDQIEFVHPRGRAAISHRELGNDFRSFAEGLRSAIASGSESDPRGRNSRPQNDGNRADRSRNRARGIQHAAHHQRSSND
jgi:ABC-type molybdenum transport system ATPase subunit/photorepair protein PhrA